MDLHRLPLASQRMHRRNFQAFCEFTTHPPTQPATQPASQPN